MLCCKRRVEDSPDETHGPRLFRKRGCTDVLSLLIFAAFWIGTCYMAFLSVHVGKPWSLIYGTDYLGNRCGRGDYEGLPKTYYPRIDEDLIAQADIALSHPWRVAFYGLCVSQCPNVSVPEDCFASPESCKVYDYGPSAQRAADFYYTTMPSLSLINRCLPT